MVFLIFGKVSADRINCVQLFDEQQGTVDVVDSVPYRMIF